MDPARLNEGMRKMRFEDLLARQTRGALGQEAAAEMLGISNADGQAPSSSGNDLRGDGYGFCD